MIKLKQLLKEDLIGFISNDYEVYKNPKSIKRMNPFLRGISFPNGDLFVVDDAYHIIHSTLAIWLRDNGFQNPIGKQNIIKSIQSGYIIWQREVNKDIFKLGESLNLGNNILVELMPYLEKYSKKVKQKHPQYVFILEGINE